MPVSLPTASSGVTDVDRQRGSHRSVATAAATHRPSQGLALKSPEQSRAIRITPPRPASLPTGVSEATGVGRWWGSGFATKVVRQEALVMEEAN